MLTQSLLSTLALAALCSATAAHAEFDPPDLTLEYQLHRRYVDSLEGHAVDATQEGWIENYNVQRGENLWSLSQMLYGDGNYWPKVWAQNRAITNPHLVRQGHTLELLLGSEDQAPSFRFSEEGDPGLELTAAPAGGSTVVEIPPPEIPPRPVIKLPLSFPAWQEVYHATSKEVIVDDSGLRWKDIPVVQRVPLNGYAQDAPVASVGTFLETEYNAGLPVAMQYVYVKLKKGRGQLGQKYLIVQDHGRIYKLNDQVEGRPTAHAVEVFGDVQLTEAATARFKNKKDYEKWDIFRALILHSSGMPLRDHDLVPGAFEFADTSPKGQVSAVAAQIIGSTNMKASALYGPGDIVFLNKGARDGLAPGHLLDIHMDRSIRDIQTEVTFSNVSNGRVKVIRVDNGCATAVVLNADDGLLQGDRAQETAKVNGAPVASPPSAEDFDLGDGAAPAAPADGAPPADGAAPPANDDFNVE